MKLLTKEEKYAFGDNAPLKVKGKRTLKRLCKATSPPLSRYPGTASAHEKSVRQLLFSRQLSCGACSVLKVREKDG